MDAAITLAKQTQRPLKIIWELNNGLNCPFDQLFEPFPNCTVINIRKDIRYNTAHYSAYGFFRSRLHRLLNALMFSKTYFENPAGYRVPEAHRLINEIKDKSKIYISASESFFENTGQYHSFKPVPEIKKQIDEAARSFNPPVIGLHLRRTDHVHAISESPDELFLKIIQQELQQNAAALFFLATDAPGTEQFFKQQFGKAIIIRNKTFGRNSSQGIKDAVADLYLLARTHSLYASYQSSFSETAAAIGNIPLKVVRRGAQ